MAHSSAQIVRVPVVYTIDHKMANIRFSFSQFVQSRITTEPVISAEMDGACVFFELKNQVACTCFIAPTIPIRPRSSHFSVNRYRNLYGCCTVFFFFVCFISYVNAPHFIRSHEKSWPSLYCSRAYVTRGMEYVCRWVEHSIGCAVEVATTAAVSETSSCLAMYRKPNQKHSGLQSLHYFIFLFVCFLPLPPKNKYCLSVADSVIFFRLFVCFTYKKNLFLCSSAPHL